MTDLFSALRGTAASQLTELMYKLIKDGDLQPGEKLPSERVLAEKAGISRASVRETMRDLELRGLVDRKPGRGTIVNHPSRPELQPGILHSFSVDDISLRQVMDLRAVIEPPIAERAAIRRSSSHIEKLREILKISDETLAEHTSASDELSVKMRELDVEFHTTLAMSTQNPLLEKLLATTHSWIAPSRKKTLLTLTRLKLSVSSHKLIFQAVADGDPAAAHEAMALHISQVQENINS